MFDLDGQLGWRPGSSGSELKLQKETFHLFQKEFFKGDLIFDDF